MKCLFGKARKLLGRKLRNWIDLMKWFVLLTLIFLLGCTSSVEEIVMEGKPMPDDYLIATFAGGCFWCTEADFEKVPGVVDVVSGFSGGSEVNPSYKDVASGKTGHTEVAQITFDPAVVSYEQLVDYFFHYHDPTDANGQFIDRGKQYRPTIFFHSEEQRVIAQKIKDEFEASGVFDGPLITEITSFSSFFLAEEYHQDYHTKNSVRYNLYRFNSGRDQFLKRVWGDTKYTINNEISTKESSKEVFVKPSDDELRKTLTPEQYRITQKDGTERPFDNKYWDNKEEGIYVDVVSGEPLFSSTDKYVSGTGWPSFTKPLEPDNIVKKKVIHKLLITNNRRIKGYLCDLSMSVEESNGSPETTST